MADEPIQVECHAGTRGDESPRAVRLDDRRREVREVRERWLEEALDPARGRRRWFRVTFRDGGGATIYQDLALDMWFLRGVEPMGRRPPQDPSAA
jgi:hypothetical protein